MRLAVIADIHGNDLALEAVLADIAGQGIGDVVNLGDCLSGPLNPARTADLLMAHPMVSIRGNHDRWLSDGNEAAMTTWDRAALPLIDDSHRRWLAALPPVLTLHGAIFACHGTPDSDTTYWLHAPNEGGQMEARAPDRVASMAGDVAGDVLLCGHTHLPHVLRLADGRLCLNPGSVGCPAYDDDHPVPHVVECGFPQSSYAILSRDACGGWSAELRRVDYDNMQMARLAASRGWPEWAAALATGRLAG